MKKNKRKRMERVRRQSKSRKKVQKKSRNVLKQNRSIGVSKNSMMAIAMQDIISVMQYLQIVSYDEVEKIRQRMLDIHENTHDINELFDKIYDIDENYEMFDACVKAGKYICNNIDELINELYLYEAGGRINTIPYEDLDDDYISIQASLAEGFVESGITKDELTQKVMSFFPEVIETDIEYAKIFMSFVFNNEFMFLV